MSLENDSFDSALETLIPDQSYARTDSALSWMFRGLIFGAMLMGTANALSFFFRSRGWGGLLGARVPDDEAIGFPLTIWEESSGYGAHVLRVAPFITCLLLAIVIGVLAGWIAIMNRKKLNQIMTRLSAKSEYQVRVQFTIRGLMIATVLSALAAAAANTMAPRPEILAAIYALGPAMLIAIAFIPRRISWQQRVAIITPATFVLMAVGIAVGNALNMEFDKVLMGVFICWTPQAAISAIVLSGWLIVREYKQLSAT